MLSVMVVTPDLGLRKGRYAVDGKTGSDKPVLCAFLGGDQPIHPDLVPMLVAADVPFFRSPERGLRAIARVLAYGDALRRTRPPGGVIQVAAAEIEAVGPVAEHRAKQILSVAGLPTPEGGLAANVDEAIAIAERIGFPVVLKAQAATLLHKSDVGGVVVGLRDADMLRAAWDRMAADVAARAPGVELDGILVEAMGTRGVEMVVGARRDPAWGPILMIGLGGIWTEALGDVHFLPADADPETIAEAVETLKGARLLLGFRGAPPADIPAFAAAAARIGALMLATPQLTEIDINPLVVYPAGDGVLALDALLVAG
jgi:acyl-CoA synthetase (NDP forming)